MAASKARRRNTKWRGGDGAAPFPTQKELPKMTVDIRLAAMRLALDFNNQKPADPEHIISVAAKFEAFLSSGDHSTAESYQRALSHQTLASVLQKGGQ
jgi:hypothetical protein